MIKIRAVREDWNDGVRLLVCETSFDGKLKAVADPIIMRTKDFKEVGLLIEPTLIISMGSAQSLMDELWGCGLRPTEGTGSAGSLKATERHLEDMRSLVFKSD